MEWFRLRGQSAKSRLRRVLLWLALLVVGLFSVFMVSTASVGAVEATWRNQNLIYEETAYSLVVDNKKIRQMGLPNGSLVFVAPEENGRVKVLHFAPGTDMTSVDSANFIEFAVDNNNYTEQSTKTVSTEPPTDEAYSGNEGASDCNVGGTGWLFCGVSRWLAQGMDWMYDKLDGFLEAQPLKINDTENGLYQMWNIMRSIANTMFVIAFMIIIYSQLSSLGVSNYGVKKMLPRLIIAALMVNLSYYICAIAIDLSNISGQAIQDMFISIRKTIEVTGTANDGAIISAESITSAVLAGGTGAAALGVGGFVLLAETGGVISSALILLLPLLLGAAITLVVVLLVLAARQALIVILTIISPLAFVCYLLPGTEKWFDKWRDLFFTMLIFFPAFSAVFGGSQLASLAILQNASTIVMAILGLGVQIAPLALAPLILKLSGGLLNRFANVVNDPTKGLIDRARNFSKDQSGYLASKKSLGLEADSIDKKQRLKRAGRWANFKRRGRKERIENYQAKADAAYAESAQHREQDMLRRQIDQRKQIADKSLDVRWSEHIRDDIDAMEKDIRLRVLVDKESLNNLKVDNRYRELQAGHLSPSFGELQEDSPIMQSMRQARSVTENLAIQGMRKNNADRVINKQLSDSLLSDERLRVEAGGIYTTGEGDNRAYLGADAALASAISTSASEYAKTVEEGARIIGHFNLSSKERQKHALGEVVEKTVNGVTYTFSPDKIFTREAAIQQQMDAGTVKEIAQIVATSGDPGNAEHRLAISSALAKSDIKRKAPFLDGKLIDDIARGDIRSKDDLYNYIQEWYATGEFDDNDLASANTHAIKLLMKAVTRDPSLMKNQSLVEKLAERKEALSEKAGNALDRPELSRDLSPNAIELLERIRNGNFDLSADEDVEDWF